mmetsp:Transcript_13599/g.28756  ORF Transcript_13599/g.28756 Transcript_13599/m.28756 type:complete len:112 (-) Transcript_13599:175-510(-)
MPVLPHGLVKYARLPKLASGASDTDTDTERAAFTETTMPKGLKNRHNTKVGTCGVLTIYNLLHRPARGSSNLSDTTRSSRVTTWDLFWNSIGSLARERSTKNERETRCHKK